jgi:hypothetical protein
MVIVIAGGGLYRERVMAKGFGQAISNVRNLRKGGGD